MEGLEWCKTLFSKCLHIPVIKLLVYVANILFALLGIALLIYGPYIYVEITSNMEFIPVEYRRADIAPLVVLLIGLYILLIALSGLCGNIRQNRLIFIVHMALLLVLILLEIGVVVFASKQAGAISERKIEEHLKPLFDESRLIEEVEKLQRERKCCGNTGPSEWNNKFPLSCCFKLQDGICIKENVYSVGCAHRIYSSIMTPMRAIGNVILFAIIIEIAEVIIVLIRIITMKRPQRGRADERVRAEET